MPQKVYIATLFTLSFIVLIFVAEVLDKGKQREMDEEETFSNLPDAVICNIISFLPSQNDILSLRTTNKWYNKNVINYDTYTRDAHHIYTKYVININ